MKLLEYNPYGCWRMDDTTPFQDYSPNNVLASTAGTEAHGSSLYPLAAYSQRFHKTNVGSFACPFYVPGRELFDFSIVASVHLNIQDNNSVQILSKNGFYDGLAVVNGEITFSTSYTAAPSAVCRYTPDYNQKFNLVGVHTATKNSLYVNGELVDEVDLTAEQQSATFNSTDTKLYSGYTTGNSKMLGNAFAVFPRALESNEIRAIHQDSNAYGDYTAGRSFGADLVLFNSSINTAEIRYLWETDSDWQQGVFANTVIDTGQLCASTQNGQTLEGLWMTSIGIELEDDQEVKSVSFDWKGYKVNIKVSTDNVNWETVSKNKAISTIPSGFDTSGTNLQIKILFAEDQDESFLDSFSAEIHLRSSVDLGSRSLNYNNAIPMEFHEPGEYHSSWGAAIGTGGSITIGADSTANPAVTRTWEIWMRPDSDLSSSFSISGATLYQNGLLANNQIKGGEWTLYHIVQSADTNAPITLNFAGILGMVNIYPTALTAQQVSDIHKTYIGQKVSRVSDAAALVLTEPAGSTLTYGHDWKISASI